MYVEHNYETIIKKICICICVYIYIHIYICIYIYIYVYIWDLMKILIRKSDRSRRDFTQSVRYLRSTVYFFSIFPICLVSLLVLV